MFPPSWAPCAACKHVKHRSVPGRDKITVDDLGEVTITNDGATILQQLDVQVRRPRPFRSNKRLRDVCAVASARAQSAGNGTAAARLLVGAGGTCRIARSGMAPHQW